jgi:hypothetical protein
MGRTDKEKRAAAKEIISTLETKTIRQSGILSGEITHGLCT